MNNKVGLLLMSHGDFATEIIKSAELIVGKQDNYATLGVHIDDQIDDLRVKMFEKLENVDQSAGLVVLVDIIGGSPMNLAGNLLTRENVLVCSGLNLPMLLELSLNRDKTIDEIKVLLGEAYSTGMTMLTNDSFGKAEEDDDLLL